MATLMEHQNRYDGLDPRAVASIRHHARRLAASRAVPGMEIEDIEQDLVLDLLRRQAAYNPHLASFATFADRVITHRVATLTAPSAKRAAERSMDSLDRPVDDDEDGGLTVGDTIRSDQALWPNDPSSDDEQTGLRIDVVRFIDGLSPALRRCSDLLMQDNLAEAARQAGLHRSSVYEAVARLRRRAGDLGLAIYLSSTPTSRHAAR